MSKTAKVEWIKQDKVEHRADLGDGVPARIRQLDAKTFAVYRQGCYLGVEATLETAQQRAMLNVRSEINREMDWQRTHPDEQPLGLRLTPEERAKGWRDSPPRAARAAVPPAPAASAPVGSSGAGGPQKAKVLDPPEATEEWFKKAKLVTPGQQMQKRSKADAGSKDAEIATLLKRGCTAEEVLRVTGWKAISMPAMAKKLGLALRIEKGRKPFKYYGTEK